jgi:ligand-binding sensor domain-containing protein
MLPLMLYLILGINLDQVEWQSLLNANLIYDIAPVEDGAWCATNGGVRFFSLKDSAFTRGFTNTDGLSHNVCRSLALVSSGELWVGTDDGLALIDPETDRVLPHPEVSGSVLSLALNGDTLAVGTPSGVFFILMKSTPASLDDDTRIPIPPLGNRSAPRMCWFKGDLWIGSDEGLRRYVPTTGSVETFSITDGLPSTDIRDLDPGDSLDVLTSKGVSRYVESSAAFHDVFLLQDTLLKVTSLAHAGDTIYVTSASGMGGYKRLFRYRESVDTLDTLGFWIDTPAGVKSTWARSMQRIKVDDWGRVWIGLGGGTDGYWGDGLIVWDGEWRTLWDGSQSFDCPGLNSNFVWHLLLDDRGNLWMTHGTRGVTRYFEDGEEGWENLYTNDSVPINNSTKVSAVDSKGRIVFGSWWTTNGVVRYDPSTNEWDEYSWGEGVSLNIITWVAVDPLDRIWVSHFNSQRMSVLSPDLQELTHINWSDIYEHVYALEFDSLGTVWAGTSAGLVAYYPPDFTQKLEGGEFAVEVPAQQVRDIALDGSGGVWGVSPEGAFHWTPDETVWYKDSNSPIPENDLVSVDRDPWGRIYFLCRNEGVVVYDPASSAYDTSHPLWQVISSYGTRLIHGFEYSWLDVDRTGRVAVGTAGGGISLFTLPRYTDSVSAKVSVYPNPCYISLGLPVRFTPLDRAKSVVIYTISGERVSEFGSNEFVTIQGMKQAELDVSRMAAGLYLAVIRFPDRTERVKFVLLR